MTPRINVCLYSADLTASDELQKLVRSIANVKVVSVEADARGLANTLRRVPVGLIAAHLDPDVKQGIAIIDQIASQFPDMGILGISARTDPDTIISAMRSGCQQFVCKPVDPDDLARAVQRIAAGRAPLASMGRRVAVIGASGGVGATTLACNLALETARQTGQRTAIVDLHMEFGDVASAFDCSPRHTLADVCGAADELDATLLETALTGIADNVSVLPRPSTIGEAAAVSTESVSRALQILPSICENIFIDAPRAFNELGMAVVEQSDLVLLVVQLTVPSVRNGIRLCGALACAGLSQEQIKIVVNRYKRNIARVQVEDLEKQFSQPPFAQIPNDYGLAAAALDYGRPIMADRRSDPVRTAIADLARRLLACGESAAPSRMGNGSLFGKLLGGSK